MLELTKKSTLQDLKKSYRTKALKYHPDKLSNRSEEVRRRGEIMFKIINNAFEMILVSFEKKERKNSPFRGPGHENETQEEFAQRRNRALDAIYNILFDLWDKNKKELVEHLNNLLKTNDNYKKNDRYSILMKIIEASGINWYNMSIYDYDIRELEKEWKEQKKEEKKKEKKEKSKKSKTEEEKSGGSALTKFTKAISKINPASIALKHKKSRNFMEQQGDLTRDYYLPELVSVGIPIAQSAAMLGSTALTGNPILGKALFDASYKTLVTDKGFDPREQSKAKKLNKASQIASKAASAKLF